MYGPSPAQAHLKVMRGRPSRRKCYARGYARSYARLIMLCARLCAAAKSVTKVMRGCPACVNDYARAMCGLCASYAQSYAHLLKTQPQLAGASPHPRGLIFFKTSEHLKVARA